MDTLMFTERRLQSLISNEINQPQVDPSSKPGFITEQIYNESIRANDLALQQLKERMAEAEMKMSKTKQTK